MPSLFIKNILYPIIGEFPLEGATQLITTLEPTSVVIGATGCDGYYAVTTVMISEKSLQYKSLRD